MSVSRYRCQIIVPEIGEHGQHKLLQAKVLVVGAGGLGCPVLQYLAAAGVGTIGIVDADFIEETNLQRQPLYTTADIGKSKACDSGDTAERPKPNDKHSFLGAKIR